MRFNTRPVWRLAQATTNGCSCGLLTGAILVTLGGLPAFLLGLAVGGSSGAALSLAQTGRRWLIVNDEGLTAVRTGYRLQAHWDDLLSFEKRRFARVIPLETVLLQNANMFRSNGDAVREKLTRKIETAGADRRVELGVYIEDRRHGPFFEMLARHRPDLAGS